MNHRLVHFQHLFSGSGYAAGYYVYLWAEVLDADGYDAFVEAGDPFSPEVAARLRRYVYGSGNSKGAAGKSCSGTWYSVGRMNYSMKDSRITDSVLGVEYDAGCWIGRFVAERLSTGRSEATTRLMLQLELVGLSRIGSNPLKVLKDNIPGYRLLREERRTTSPSDDRSSAAFYD